MDMKIDNLSEELAKETERKWDEFRTASDSAGIFPLDDPERLSLFKRVFTFSDFVAKTCIRHPQVPNDLILSGDLQRTYLTDEYDHKLRNLLFQVAEEDALIRILRVFRRREMLRIACRDLAGLADLSETMGDLSAFADACVGHALSLLYQWQCATSGIPFGSDGSPQHLVVIAMGKLGAGELNFSSDIDLIFAYPEIGETTPLAAHPSPLAPLNNDEFFLKLCRRLVKVLSTKTPEGFVFRVDVGLRPYGESGPLVMSFDAMENYYQSQGREWERYAWIKARPSAGDTAAGQRLIARLNPFVYRKYLDFGAFESLREMKQKISLEVRRKGMKADIKLGPGGIREIEFFGQIFQLIRGGFVRSLQEPGIQKVLQTLARENHISQKVCNELNTAYLFLRNTEHHLQEFSDQQTQKLPRDPLGKECLSRSMGFAFQKEFASQLGQHMETVHHHFMNLLKTKDSEKREGNIRNALHSLWKKQAGEEHAQQVLAQAGFDPPGEPLKLLKDLRDDLARTEITREGRDRIDRLIPLVLEETGLSKHSGLALNRIIDLIQSIKKRTSYISLLLENPIARTHLVRLANESSWILTYLTRHPVLLDEFLDPQTLYAPPKRPELEAKLRHRLDQIPSQDLEYQMDGLRTFNQMNILRVAAADITEALPLMKVSDHLSDIAETILNEVVELAWNHLVDIHGKPVCRLKEDRFDKGFAIIAYGKLGGLELGYVSDLDLVFLHAGTNEETQGGNRPIESNYFFARLGQRVIHILTARTPAGILYEADMRLRPSGRSGSLVCHIDAFQAYQMAEAWTWEKQALIRARFVNGNIRLASRFADIRRAGLAQPRDPVTLRKEVVEMRERMRKELVTPEPDIFDLKQDRGGMVDVEFLVQYLVLLKSHEHPEILRWTDNVRLIGVLAETEVIDRVTAYFLRKAYLTYRTVSHRLSLQDRAAKVPEGRFRLLREKVADIWNDFLGNVPTSPY